MMKRFLLISILVLAILLTLFPMPAAIQAGEYHYEPVLVVNPYQGVDWQAFGQYKANLHTHTNLSDGRLSPEQVIDAYHSLGYKILALTDHDSLGPPGPTWPWQDYNRDPDVSGMVAVMGNELSYQHHIGSFFNDYYGHKGSSPQQSLEEIGRRKGLAVFFHPGRYNKPDNWSWYKPFFNKHKHLLGLEVFNQGDRYPNDRLLWDNLLTDMMPDRPIWGFSNDDAHRESHIGRNWNTLLLEGLNETSVRQALQAGRFYATYQPGDIQAPIIKAINLTNTTITIEAENYSTISWISQGKVIHLGKTLKYKDISGLGSYVRAEITGSGGTVITNPFGFEYPDRVTGVSLDKTALTLTEGDGPHLLKATITPSKAINKEITWASKHPAVASVDSTGAVRAHKPGTTVITVTTADGGFSASCSVTVKKLVILPRVVDIEETVDMKVGEMIQLHATVSPDNATDKRLQWSSSDPTVVRVDSTGNVEALGAGTAIVSALSVTGVVSGQCVVTVTEVMPEAVILTFQELILTLGEEYQLEAEVLPENTTTKTLLWSSDDPAVASVDNGLVQALAPGIVRLTAKTLDGTVSAICLINVLPYAQTVDKPLLYPLEQGTNNFSIPSFLLRGENLLIFKYNNLSVSVPVELLQPTMGEARESDLSVYIRAREAEGINEQTFASMYDFSLYHNNHALTEFSGMISISFSVDPNLLKRRIPSIYWLDENSDSWIPLESNLDSDQGVITTKINHLSSFALSVPRPKFALVPLMLAIGAGAASILALALYILGNRGA